MKQAVFRILDTRIVCVLFEHIEEWGLCFRDERRIIIRRSLCERNQIRVLIHEHIHYLRPRLVEDAVLEKEDIVYRSLSGEEYRLLKAHLDFWKKLHGIAPMFL